MSVRVRSVGRRDPRLYDDPSTHDDRLIAIVAYRRGCRCENCKHHKRLELARWKAARPPAIRSKEKFRDNIRCKYGLSQPQYEQLVKDQAGKCRICDRARKLVVDHCHVSGVVRGLLCSRCNNLLGMATDSAAILLSAIAYLEEQG